MIKEADYIKISEYAERMSVNYRTVYRKFHDNKIEGFQDPDTGSIYLKNPFKQHSMNRSNRVVLYTRVSSSQNKSNLDSQLERLRLFALAKGYTVVKEVKEIGSGLNDNRPKLLDLLSKDLDSYDILLVEHSDRLTRFGNSYITTLLTQLNKQVEVINEIVEDEEDLIQDFISIITSYCARIYGKRRSQRKTEQLIEELKKEWFILFIIK